MLGLDWRTSLNAIQNEFSFTTTFSTCNVTDISLPNRHFLDRRRCVMAVSDWDLSRALLESQYVSTSDSIECMRLSFFTYSLSPGLRFPASVWTAGLIDS